MLRLIKTREPLSVPEAANALSANRYTLKAKFFELVQKGYAEQHGKDRAGLTTAGWKNNKVHGNGRHGGVQKGHKKTRNNKRFASLRVILKWWRRGESNP